MITPEGGLAWKHRLSNALTLDSGMAGANKSSSRPKALTPESDMALSSTYNSRLRYIKIRSRRKQKSPRNEMLV